jgi:hypothetical protein
MNRHWAPPPSVWLLKLNKFDTVLQPLRFPANAMLFRGHGDFSAVSDRPAYFTSDVNVSRGYAEQYGQVGRVTTFITTKELRLIDARHMSAVLSLVFQSLPKGGATHDVEKVVACMSLAFGICSLRHQVELVYRFYKEDLDRNEGPVKEYTALKKYLDDHRPSLVEPRGVRVAETNNDATAVMFLSQIFKGVHGYVAPRMHSPFHVEVSDRHTPAEIVLFRPHDCALASFKTESHRVLPTMPMPVQHSVFDAVTNAVSLVGLSASWPGVPNTLVQAGGARKKSSRFCLSVRTFDPSALERMPKQQYAKLRRSAERAASKVRQAATPQGGGMFDDPMPPMPPNVSAQSMSALQPWTYPKFRPNPRPRYLPEDEVFMTPQAIERVQRLKAEGRIDELGHEIDFSDASPVDGEQRPVTGALL